MDKSSIDLHLLLSLARGGMRQIDLATEFGIAQSTVSKILRTNGISRGRDWASDHVLDTVIVKLRNEGLTVSDIANKLNITKKAVISASKRGGITKTTKGPPPKLSQDQIQMLLQRRRDGAYYDDLSIEFGISKAIVARLLLKNGLRERPYKPRKETIKNNRGL